MQHISQVVTTLQSQDPTNPCMTTTHAQLSRYHISNTTCNKGQQMSGKGDITVNSLALYICCLTLLPLTDQADKTIRLQHKMPCMGSPTIEVQYRVRCVHATGIMSCTIQIKATVRLLQGITHSRFNQSKQTAQVCKSSWWRSPVRRD
jgi:hypothetical protein